MNPFTQKILSASRYIPSGGGRNTSPLSQISGIQALWDLDATLSASYSGSGTTWANMITAPADGSAQSAYDFVTGDGSTSSTYPTFNGTSNDAAAYWSFDGGDYFTIASGNTVLLNSLQITAGSPDFTIICAYKNTSSTTTYAIFGNSNSSAPAGMILHVTSGTSMSFRQFRTTGTTTTNLSSSIPLSSDMILSASINYSSSSAQSSVNSRTFTSATVNKGTTFTPASNPYNIASANTNEKFVSTFRMYGCYAFNKILTDTDLSNVYDVLNSRHNRTYA